MKPGDLVRWYGKVGIVTHRSVDGYMYMVSYTDGTIGHHCDYDLEVIYESG